MFDPAIWAGAGTAWNYSEALGYDRAPFSCVPAGPNGIAAGPDGVAWGCFGWVDADSGVVTNSKVDGGALGFIIPQPPLFMVEWDRVFLSLRSGIPQMILRSGYSCVVATQGNFIARFPLGGQAGFAVYADPVTGLPHTTNPGSYVATKFVAMRSGGPGARLPITSFTEPFRT